MLKLIFMILHYYHLWSHSNKNNTCFILYLSLKECYIVYYEINVHGMICSQKNIRLLILHHIRRWSSINNKPIISKQLLVSFMIIYQSLIIFIHEKYRTSTTSSTPTASLSKWALIWLVYGTHESAWSGASARWTTLSCIWSNICCMQSYTVG